MTNSLIISNSRSVGCPRQSGCCPTALHYPGPPDLSQLSFLITYFCWRTIPCTIITSSEGTPSTGSHQSPGLFHGIQRVGPHGLNYCHAVHAPAGNKKCKQAQDVQTFFIEEEGLYVCLFCMSVSCCLTCFIFSGTFIGRSMHLTHNIWLYGMGKRPAPLFAKVTCGNHIRVHRLLPVINLALISWPRVHRTLFRNIENSTTK